VSKSPPDDALSDRYELSDQLGAGGMATVFLGRDRVLGRTVAVKTLLTQFSGDPHFIERFRREAQSAAALNHPNIVSVYDTGADDGTHFIVMEFVDGRTLRDVIREEGPLLAERAAEIGADVCAGLSFAHAHGIVHRDIKPANIMVTPSGGVKVTDFGIARAVSGETVTQTAQVLGTAQYFSPEQAQGQPVDARSDLYSLGVVLYEMLTRTVPFTGSSAVAIAYKHVKEAPIPPSRVNPDVPPALEAIVMKAMAKNPNNRYQSAQEMREDLLRALHGRPVEATPVLTDATGMIDVLSDETVVLERGPRPIGVGHVRTEDEQRRRTGMLLLALIVLGILGVAVWAFMGLANSPEKVTLPDVIGQTAAKAQDTLERRHFKVRFLDAVYSAKIDEGLVAIQDPGPPAVTELEEGSTVKLALSLGPEQFSVPDVRGKSLSDARASLIKAGFKVGDVDYDSSETVRVGIVMDQKPPAAASAAKGTKVDLVVSSGPSPSDVPNVVGDRQQDAERALTLAGFKFEVIYEDQSPDCDQEIGRVCRQDPSGDERLRRGSTVTIYVARQPEESPTPTPSESTSPSTSPSETASP
jgi:eukaryotic-like serine/threonine-protein kinase